MPEAKVVDPAWFSAVMGTAGTAAVAANNPGGAAALAGAGTAIAWTLLAVAGALFVVLCMLFALRPDRRRRWEDMGSARRGPAFATIPAAMLVLLAALYGTKPDAVSSGAAWWAALVWNGAGAALALLVTVRLFVSAFETDDFPMIEVSGVWFIPETALLLSGMVAGHQALAAPAHWQEPLVTLALALAGAGIVLFALTAAMFFNRLVAHPHVRRGGAPTTWIMLSPLSVSALTLHQVVADTAVLDVRPGSLAAVELFAMLLWGFSLWWVVAASVVTWNSRAAALTRGPADWGYVFPTAALSLATLTLGRSWDSALMEFLGAVFAVVLLAVWAGVAVTSLRPAPH